MSIEPQTLRRSRKCGKIDTLTYAKTKRIDTSTALKQYINGYSQADIARMQGVTRQAVDQALRPFKAILSNPQSIQAFDNERDKLLSAGQAKLLVAALDGRAIKKSSTLQLASSFGILFDKQRLVRGESTDNIDVKSMVQYMMADRDKLQTRVRELNTIPDVVIEPTDRGD